MQVGWGISRTGLDSLTVYWGEILRRCVWGWEVDGLEFHARQLDLTLRQREPWDDLSRLLAWAECCGETAFRAACGVAGKELMQWQHKGLDNRLAVVIGICWLWFLSPPLTHPQLLNFCSGCTDLVCSMSISWSLGYIPLAAPELFMMELKII